MKTKTITLFAFAPVLVLPGLVLAKGKATIDRYKVDKDFAIQGEYVGELTKDGKTSKWGGHAIALGNGKFRGLGYPGGLPGDGWNGEKTKPAEGGWEGNRVVLLNEEVRIELSDGTAKVFDSGGQKMSTMKRVERKSSTLGAKPPAGAIVLFDGSTADHFEKGKVSEKGWLMQGVTAKQKVKDFSCHLEFLLPYMPESRGQGRGNSGCYVQGRYEIQMLDSFGLEGKDNECGGIYKASAPRVNMCYPPLSWQTYDFDFTAPRYEGDKKVKNARITVRHNGVAIHDDLELPGDTPGGRSKEGPDAGPAIYLQDHGNPVRYRNIWLVEK